MSRLKRLIQEIHRRSLWQVLGIYLGGAWVALQGIEALASVLGLPEWVPGMALVILIAFQVEEWRAERQADRALDAALARLHEEEPELGDHQAASNQNAPFAHGKGIRSLYISASMTFWKMVISKKR